MKVKPDRFWPNVAREKTIEQIGKALRAGTNCGSCIPELKGLVAESARSGAAPA